jgi:hypothetical protein
MSATFFEELVRNDRKLELDYEQATDGASAAENRVRADASLYLEGYVAFNCISREAVATSYEKTIRRYANDIRAFTKTGLYPLQIDKAQPHLPRLDYDLFLILTVLVTKHRCALMAELSAFPASGKTLVIGVGSGIEITYLGAAGNGEAYDLYINGFARQAFSNWQFREELYRPIGQQYGSIYAVELLEHLEEPYKFLSECRASLAPGGRLVVTTATNVPQFDHTINFTSDEEFEGRACGLGLALKHKRVVPHAYARTDIGARNVFYAFARTE